MSPPSAVTACATCTRAVQWLPTRYGADLAFEPDPVAARKTPHGWVKQADTPWTPLAAVTYAQRRVVRWVRVLHHCPRMPAAA